MQEEVEQRSLTLVINSGKMTGRVLKSAIVSAACGAFAHRGCREGQEREEVPAQHGVWLCALGYA